jgi:hypothetical protein
MQVANKMGNIRNIIDRKQAEDALQKLHAEGDQWPGLELEYRYPCIWKCWCSKL